MNHHYAQLREALSRALSEPREENSRYFTDIAVMITRRMVRIARNTLK